MIKKGGKEKRCQQWVSTDHRTKWAWKSLHTQLVRAKSPKWGEAPGSRDPLCLPCTSPGMVLPVKSLPLHQSSKNCQVSQANTTCSHPLLHGHGGYWSESMGVCLEDSGAMIWRVGFPNKLGPSELGHALPLASSLLSSATSMALVSKRSDLQTSPYPLWENWRYY